VNDDLQSFWNRYALSYAFLNESSVYRHLLAESISLANIQPGMHCLDLGCGPGNYLIEITRRGSSCLGVDFSQTMIAIARKNIRRSSPETKVPLKCADALDFLETVSAESYDVTFASLLLSYLEKPKEVVGEIYRTLKSPGRFVMSNPVPQANFTKVLRDSFTDILRKPRRFIPLAFRIWRYAKRIERLSDQGVFRFFTEKETVSLLKNAGFQSDRISIRATFSGQVYLTLATK
jgi:ubiquinone/menaquinone biosynthesis C-methylase UbiE